MPAFARPALCAKSFRMKRHTLICALLSLALVAVVFAQKPAPVKERSVPPLAGDQRDEKLWQRALKLHKSAIVVDTHNDITTMMEDTDYDIGDSSVGRYHTDLARMKEGGLTAEFFSIFVDKKYAEQGGAARRALDQIDWVYRSVERHPQQLMLATSAADIRRAKKAGKVAALMGIEGGHAIENSLFALRDFYRLGVR